MRDIILGLKESSIITEKNVADLKKYILKKYSGYDSENISLILADGIQRIIDKNIVELDENKRKIIRSNLVIRAIAKKRFEINAYEVFCEYIENSDKSEGSIDVLMDWINVKQEKPINREELVDLVSILGMHDGKKIDEKLEGVLNKMYSALQDNEEEQSSEKSHNDFSNREEALSINFGEISVNSDGSLECSESQQFNKRFASFQTYFKNNLLIHPKKIGIISAVCLCALLIISNGNRIRTLFEKDAEVVIDAIENQRLDKDHGYEGIRLGSELAEDFRYIEIDRMMMKGWLDGRNSMLAEEPYFSTILDTARRYDISPLLMFSITGQEQGFVPKDQANASRIANNPFNVYGSWQSYNTDIKDASEIAARTIINLSKGKPEDVDTIQWINRKYAEDKNWWKGVSRIYSDLKRYIIE